MKLLRKTDVSAHIRSYSERRRFAKSDLADRDIFYRALRRVKFSGGFYGRIYTAAVRSPERAGFDGISCGREPQRIKGDATAAAAAKIKSRGAKRSAPESELRARAECTWNLTRGADLSFGPAINSRSMINIIFTSDTIVFNVPRFLKNYPDTCARAPKCRL